MLQKKLLSGRKVEVTFRMPPLDDVVELYLCGDFSGWQVKGVPLRQESDGTWVATLVLEAGKSYRFRYHDNQGRWLNDREADAYVPNDFGSDDSVVDLTASAKESSNAHATDKPAAKKAAAPATKKAATPATKKAATPATKKAATLNKNDGGRHAKAKR
jgi:1,4-alpha-glucan branching enzyme